MPLLETKGAASAQGFGLTLGGAAPVYIEDVFSTWLYPGNGSTQTITNGVDLSGKGGLVWIKGRTLASSQGWFDTIRGATKFIQSNSATNENTDASTLTSFNSNGFSLGSNGNFNSNNQLFASWAFREQPKFFDMVTWTGNNAAGRQIPHSLASVPGCIMVKGFNLSIDWYVYHRGADVGNPAEYKRAALNSAGAFTTTTAAWNDTAPTSTNFTVGTDLNNSNYTYVAYLFAHDAGGFGLSGTDSVVSCGKYVGNGTGSNAITVGFEPQWLLVKYVDGGDWVMVDTMRGLFTGAATDQSLAANTTPAENDVLGTTPFIATNATGFTLEAATPLNASGNNYVYIAIRRGPMKVPTTGTSVFSPIAVNAPAGTQQTTSFPVDLQIFRTRTNSDSNYVIDRLRGVTTTPTQTAATRRLETNSIGAEADSSSLARNWNNTGFAISSSFGSLDQIYWNFRRAPRFFDEVCYSGTGSPRTVAHNLGVAPRLIIVKDRSNSRTWAVYSVTAGNVFWLRLNTTNAIEFTGAMWNSTTPTSSVFTVGTANEVNNSVSNYVAYLFASCPGVSSVGTYTGTGATQVINCGFAAGTRFVLIKDYIAEGNWYVWDSARGIVAGNDPYLLLNNTPAEVTNTDWVDTAATGFELSNAGGNLVNTNGNSYIFLAIA